jgi:TfoX N-terminal domain
VAVDETLAARVRERVNRVPDWSEKRMFGGIAFLIDGNMAVGVSGHDLMVRVGPAADAEALSRPGARPFDMTGRPMAGWVLVGPEGYAEESAFAAWVDEGVAFAVSLPRK